MFVYKDNDKYIFKCTYEKRYIPKQAGFKWDPNKKVWYTNDKNKLYSIDEKYLSDELYNELYDTVSDDIIVSPDGLEYMSFQKKDIKTIINKKNILLAYEMGVGKTITTIGVINALNKLGKLNNHILIICPSIMLIKWERELHKWLVDEDLKKEIRYYNSRRKLKLDKYRIAIISIDSVKKYREELDKYKFDLIVIDEAHKLKDRTRPRTKYIFGGLLKQKGTIKKKRISKLDAEYKILLTGTPLTKSPFDVFTLANYLRPDIWNNWYDFGVKYCGLTKNEFGQWVETGSANELDLHNKLVNTVMIRRKLREITDQIPKEIVHTLFIELSKKELDSIKDDFIIEIEKELKKLSTSFEKQQITAEEFRMRFTSILNKFDKSDVSPKFKRRLGLIKIPYIVSMAKDLMEKTDKLVVFTYHKDVTKKVAEELNAPYIIGGMSNTDKQKIVDDFQNNKNTKVIVAAIPTAGVGIDLIVSDTILFGEIDYKEDDISQAQARIIRIGQERTPNIYYLLAANTLDDHIGNILISKRTLFNKVIDGQDSLELEVANDIFD